jgi:hypothetical protein
MTINDSRLLNALDDMRTALEQTYDVSRGSFTVPEDGTELRSVVHAQRECFERLLKLLDPELFTPCGKIHHLGAKCVRQDDHGGFHRSCYGQTWTDETDAAGAANVAKSMEGKRD